MRILLVDDEHIMLRVISRALQAFDLTAVDRVDLALGLLEQEHFDVVISDNSMPERTGVDLLTAMAERYPTVRRVMHSGAQPEGLEELQRKRVVELFVHKPGLGDLVEFCTRARDETK